MKIGMGLIFKNGGRYKMFRVQLMDLMHKFLSLVSTVPLGARLSQSDEGYDT